MTEADNIRSVPFLLTSGHFRFCCLSRPASSRLPYRRIGRSPAHGAKCDGERRDVRGGVRSLSRLFASHSITGGAAPEGTERRKE